MNLWDKLAARKQPAQAPMFYRGMDQLAVNELGRITSLPVSAPTPWDGSSVRKAAGIDLRPLQQQALGAMREAKGGFFPLAVGAGKTYVSVLAGAALGCDLAILLVPPRTVQQTYDALAKADGCFRLPRTEVVPYSILSRAEASDLLERLISGYAPERVVVVADEAHNLKRFTSARTKRVVRFFEAHAGVQFVAMSGTLTSKSIKDFAHLAEWALGTGSPVPRLSHSHGRAALAHWSACIDSEGRPGSHDWFWCEPLWRWNSTQPANLLMADYKQRREGVRKALARRIATAPGVVSTTESSLGTALYVEHWASLHVPIEIAEAMADVEETQCRPDGEALESPVEQWRVMRQLSLGFYYRWVWPGGMPDLEWLAARSAWNKAVRQQLDRHAREGYDSPLLVYNRVAREHALGQRQAIHRAWEDWCKVKGRPTPPTEAVWVSPKVLDTVSAEVLHSKETTLVWYSDDAVATALAKRGVEVVPAGKPVPVDRPRTLAVSVRSHGTGLNLQPWANNVILTPDQSGLVWEQLLGRTHRPGQQADEVWATVLAHTHAFRDALALAKTNAEYIQHTTGQKQKFLLATHIEK